MLSIARAVHLGSPLTHMCFERTCVDIHASQDSCQYGCLHQQGRSAPDMPFCSDTMQNKLEPGAVALFIEPVGRKFYTMVISSRPSYGSLRGPEQ